MQLIYFADPMCSWCWGFSPVFERVRAAVGTRAEVRYVMGGLRAFNEQPMDEEQKRYIGGHWGHVNERSGQPFNHAFFDRDDFIYDTEPACRAVVTVRGLAPDRQGDMLRAVHKAFYLENRDVTDAEVLADIAAGIGIAREDFADAFDLDATHDATKIDFMITQQTGVQGFPTLLFGEQGTPFEVVTAGYAEAEVVETRLAEVMKKFAA